MRTVIILTATFVLFADATWAQQSTTRTAVLQPDGSQRIETTASNGEPAVVPVAKGASFEDEYAKYLKHDASGANTTSNSAASNTTSRKYIRHEAIMRPDGAQEMHFFDADGNVTVIQAEQGKSLQQTYWDFLAKEGIPCPCGGESTSETSETKVATLPSAVLQK